MQFRCPACRRNTHIPDELVEHLARCERCGTLLHVRATPAANGAFKFAVEPIRRPPMVQAQWVPTGLFNAPARPCWPGPVRSRSESMGDPLTELAAAQRQMPVRRETRRTRKSLRARFLGLLTMGSLVLMIAAAALGLCWLKMTGVATPRPAQARVVYGEAVSQTPAAAHPAPSAPAKPHHAEAPRSTPVDLTTSSGSMPGDLFPEARGTPQH